MNFNFKKFFNWILLILWMGVIFFLSSQPDLKSSFESQIDFILRKIAHMTEFAVLTFLAWRTIGDGAKSKKYLIYAIIFSVIYALSDEYHQTFVQGRVGSPVDVLIDSMGMVIMAILIGKEELKN